MSVVEEREGCIWLFRCDACGKEFEGVKHKANAKTQGCSRSCGSRASRETVKNNLLEKYGVVNVSQLPEVRAKVEQTSLEKFGTTCSFASPEVKEKIKEAVREKYGVDFVSQAPEVRVSVNKTLIERYGGLAFSAPVIREKTRQTMLERYSVENPQQVPEIREATKRTHVLRYGVENPQQVLEFKAKTQQTCLERYGANSVFQSDIIREKIRQTSLARYGVERPIQSPDIQRKIFETMRKNGSGKGFVSKGELACLELLRSIFGEDDVVHQVRLHRWLVDFHVISSGVYGQFDGTYWHGLTLTEEQLKNPATCRERDIAKKWTRDQEQNVWCRDNQVTLVRIPEADFKSWVSDGTEIDHLHEIFRGNIE